MMKKAVTAAVAASIALGCSSDPSVPANAMIRDSAGVRIVLNADSPLPSWRLSEDAVLSIGSVNGEGGQDLALPWSSVRVADGRIAVANARTDELRFYDSTGSFIRAVGGKGEGPGEFGLIALLNTFRGDSIIAADAMNPRLTLFDSEGAFGRTVSLGDLEGRLPRFQGLLTEDIGLYRVTFFQRGGGRSRAVRDTFLLALKSFDGPWNHIGRFAANEKFNQWLPNGSVAAWNLPFARSVQTAVGNGVAWVGVSDKYEVKAYGTDGTLKQIVRVDRAPRPVTDDLRARFFAHQIDSADDDDQRRRFRSVHDIIEFPPTLPAFSALQLDSEGRLWVREYELPWETGPAVWRVFDTEGIARAVVDLPSALTIQEIGHDYLRGLWRDELGVEFIRAYAIIR